MSKENAQPTTNPLFSPSNNFNFPTNTLFMPVAEQTSAIFSAEPGEEEQFLGSSNDNANNPQNGGVPTFSAFSNSQGDDPFSSIGNPQLATLSTPNTTASAQEEPKLFVPPSTPSPTTVDSNVMYPPQSTNQTSLSGPPIAFDSPPGAPPAAPAQINPYSRGVQGPRHRQMFVPNPLIKTSQTPVAQIPPSSQFPPQAFPPQSTPPVSFPPQSAPPTNFTPQSAPPVNFTPQSAPPTTLSAPPTTPYQDNKSSVIPPSFDRVAAGGVYPPPMTNYLQPVTPHWFYCKVLSDNNKIWCPFSFCDSAALEAAFQQGAESEVAISTDGGRYDVDLNKMQRMSVYWDEAPSQVRRCTWFRKSETDVHFQPYNEDTSQILEDEYIRATKENTWHKRVDLDEGEILILHGPQLVVHSVPAAGKDQFGSFSESPRSEMIVKRGIRSTDFLKDVPDDELGVPDHIVFFCHGIGPVCDLRKRSIVECVDDFRGIHQSLLRSHFKTNFEAGKAQRIEFLPIHWHRALHGDATGVDCKIRSLTLPSISRLRQFTNETLLDILFYSSPVYCQTIAETVGNEINSLYQLFMTRNPNFQGRVSLAGHSLGSLILFDLLCHQNDGSKKPAAEVVPTQPETTALQPEVQLLSKEANLIKGFHSTNSLTSTKSSVVVDDTPAVTTIEEVLEKLSLEKFTSTFEQEQVDFDSLLMCSESDLKDLGVPMGPRKKLSAFVKDHKEKEEKKKEIEEAQKSAAPIPVLDVPPPPTEQPDVDDFDNMDPIQSGATNVHVDFQQFDTGTGQPTVRYPQLDFKPQTLFAFGSPIGMFLTVRGIEELGEEFKFPTCDGFLNVFHPFDPVAYRVEPLINPEFEGKPILVPHHMGRKRLHIELRESLGRMGQELKQGIMRSVRMAIGSVQRFAQTHWNQSQPSEAQVEEDVKNMTEQLLNQNTAVDQDDTASIISEPPPSEGIGLLNGGKRIDYVLQERPLESFNDYLFAFQSHLCYWSNEDTVLLLMKDIYEKENILSDRQLKKTASGPPQFATNPPALGPGGDQVTNINPGPPLIPPTTNIPLS